MIDYDTAQTTLGRILVAVCSGAVVAVALDDEDAPLVKWLAQKYSQSRRNAQTVGLHAALRAVAAFVERPVSQPDVVIDMRGTPFQHRVWQALLTVPSGQTRSYGEIAAMIGAPGAVRAVAGACAANPLALLVPCHRIIARDGGLAGYRWGLERKRALLLREAALSGQ